MPIEQDTPAPVSRSARGRHRDFCPCCGGRLATRGDRPFTLIDAMILIAASALAMAILRPVLWGPLVGQSTWSRYLALSIGWLVVWTPTLLFLRLRDPRPSVRRLSRQPGFAASLAGTTVLTLGLIAIVLLALARSARKIPATGPAVGLPLQDPSWWIWVVLHFGAVIGPAIIAAWMLLAISGRRRPTRGWIDILARCVGTCWIILFVINCCVRFASLVR